MLPRTDGGVHKDLTLTRVLAWCYANRRSQPVALKGVRKKSGALGGLGHSVTTI